MTKKQSFLEKESYLEELYLNTGISPDHLYCIIKNFLPVTSNIYNKLIGFEKERFYNYLKLKKVIDIESTISKKTFRNIRTNYKNILNDFTNYLFQIKNYCFKVERLCKDEHDKIKYVNSISQKFVIHINQYFGKIWYFFKYLPKNRMEDFQFYYQKKLVPFFGTDVFNEFVYLKPLGYAGDFIVSGYIYDNNYSGDSVFAKLIHKYSLSLPMAQAHFHRKSYLKDEIERCLKTKKNPRIISLGCGPAREIIEYLLEKRFLPKKYEIYCLDFEKLAIKCLKRRIRHIELKLQKKINIEYVGGNILEFVGSNKWQSNLGEFDLVYMAGVLDYFDNKIASHIIKNVFSSIVRPKGRFIVINVFEDSISRAYYELLGGWKLHHRNKANLLSLCKNIDFTRKITVSFCKKTKKNLYLTLVRK